VGGSVKVAHAEVGKTRPGAFEGWHQYWTPDTGPIRDCLVRIYSGRVNLCSAIRDNTLLIRL
jgi:hypothetical protein